MPCLRGSINFVQFDNGGQDRAGYVEVAQEDGAPPVVLSVSPSWVNLLEQLAEAQEQMQRDGDERELAVAAYHLKQGRDGELLAGPDSLLVLEPDWLINVTDLRHVEYCPRQYLNHRFSPVVPNEYIVRGNIVHRTFEQMIKTPADSDAITQALKQSYFRHARAMALLGETKDGMWTEVGPRYSQAKRWVAAEPLPPSVKAETFVIAPEVGLQGKIDALWLTEGEVRVVGELKTGRSQGGNPRLGDRLQMGAYCLTLMAQERRDGADPPRALLLYLGNDRLAHGLNINREVPLSPELFREVIDQRNRLVLIDYLADAPFETRYPRKCDKCRMAEDCEAMAALLEHDDPRPAHLRYRFDLPDLYDPDVRAWFRTYTHLLAREYRAVKAEHARLWRLAPEDRVQAGKTIIAQSVEAREPTPDGEHPYAIEADNQSELREGDVVLVSSDQGPLSGQIAMGYVRGVRETGLEVAFNEQLEFTPKFVDEYVSESLAARNFAGIYLWLRQAHVRPPLIRKRPPTFSSGDVRAVLSPRRRI